MAETLEPAVETPPSDPYKGLPTFERMFRQELAALDVKLDAFIFTPPVDWMPKQFFYCLTFPNGNTRKGNIAYDVGTYATILEEARTP